MKSPGDLLGVPCVVEILSQWKPQVWTIEPHALGWRASRSKPGVSLRDSATREFRRTGKSTMSDRAALTAEQFAAEFQAHWRPLWCIAAGVLGSRERAGDVLQDAALTGLRKLDDFTPGTSFVHWMGQIVRFTALNQARQHRRDRRVTVDRLDGLTTDNKGGPRGTTNGVVTTDPSAIDERMQQALSELTEEARSCLLLRVIGGLSYAEIAAALQMPENTAMSHVHRARLALRGRLIDSHEARREGGTA